MKRFAVIVLAVVITICMSGIYCFAEDPTAGPTQRPTLEPYHVLSTSDVTAENFIGTVWSLKSNWADYENNYGPIHVNFSTVEPNNMSDVDYYIIGTSSHSSGNTNITLYYYYTSTQRHTVSRYTYDTQQYEYFSYSNYYIKITGMGSDSFTKDFNFLSSYFDVVYIPGNGVENVIEGAKVTLNNFLIIGDSLVTFVVGNWITLIALTAFVVVFGIGVVIRIVKKRG